MIGSLPARPAGGSPLPQLPDAEVIPPTIEQVTALVDAMPERYRAAALD